MKFCTFVFGKAVVFIACVRKKKRRNLSKVYVPEGVDVEELEVRLGFREKIKYYKRDKLAYILSLPNHIATYDKRRLLADGFVPISSDILQDLTGNNYREYIDLLLKAKVFETKDSFVIGGRCKQFRLATELKTGVKPYELADKTFKNALNRKYRGIKGDRIDQYGYLTKWFTNGLQINSALAGEFLMDELLMKTWFPELRDVEEGRVKSPDLQFNCAKILIDCMNSNEDIYLSVDDKGNRLHSPLTNIRSILRNAISYKGQKLTSIDIRNSQPFFSSMLFQMDFWEKEIIKPKYNSILTSILSNHQTTSPIMLLTIGDLLKQADVATYVASVKSGRFYEEFQEAYEKRYGVANISRTKVKKAILKMMYSRNSSVSKIKKMFGILYPSVLELFTYIKHEEHKLLPILLQRIESDMVLDDIAFHFTNAYPELPIFTIHDSLVTLASDYDKLEECMIERFINRMDMVPQFRIECWEEEKLVQAHENLIKGII